MYWPGTGTVTVEHNVYSGASALLEGEDNDFVIIDNDSSPPSVGGVSMASCRARPLQSLPNPPTLRRQRSRSGAMTTSSLVTCSPRDTIAVRLSHYDITSVRWTKVISEYRAKSVYAQNDLESAFFDMRCQKGGDVRAFALQA
ncbi:hypothetical protein BJV78DRAFT_131876 [Lactifluus subvellereus]|nr:hypothetical protein BJV78DRAFT_131876 [Lactifluus subvellereus]